MEPVFNHNLCWLNRFAEADGTLMEDPEDRLDDVILKGVALRPRVNSERNVDRNIEHHVHRVGDKSVPDPKIT